MKVNFKKWLILFLLVLSIISVKNLFILDKKNTVKNNNDTSQKKELMNEKNFDNKQNKIKKLQNDYQNNDIVGILKIENTDLNSIIVKTIDNEYYLDHDLKKEKNNLGTAFMDYRNDTHDKKILIYGHNSQKIETEFHLLENFLNESYYQKHQNIIFKTIDNIYIYKIFSIIIVTTDYQHMKLSFTKDEWKEHLVFLKENTLYTTGVEINEQDDIIVLQTCYYEPKDSYILLVGKKIKHENS